MTNDDLKVLRPLKPRVKILSDFYVFDVETGVDAPYCELPKQEPVIIHNGIQWVLEARPDKFKFGVIYGRNYTKVIYSVEEFKQTLLEPRFKGRYVFAHNGGNFDNNVIWDNVFYCDPNAIFNGSRFISFTNGNCIIADSINIFVGQSVKKIGIQIGNTKQQLGDDELWSPNGITSKEINYCINDCIIIWDALFKSFEFAGAIKITQASLSMTYFRRHHLKHAIEWNSYNKFFRQTYFGGRTEAFFIGLTHAVVYDVKSMYPDRMKHERFPNPKHLKIEYGISVENFLSGIIDHYEGAIFCTVWHAPIRIGLLPIKKEGKLLFPVGNLSGSWNFNEFRFALSTGYVKIIRIDKIVYSEGMPSPLESFVDELFSLKSKAEAEKNDFWRDLYKRFVNSLYGKFAMQIDEEIIYIENMEKQFDTILEYQNKHLFRRLILFNKDRLDCFLVIKSMKNLTISYAIISIASYITSGARAKMAMKLLASEANKVVYCDTDSIFIENDVGMISENHLGGWGKEEGKIVTEIKGLKNYKYIDNGVEKRRLKGVPLKAEQIAENDYRFFNLTKTKESLRRDFDPGVLIERKKHITNKYDKRTVDKDGETNPIEL